MTTKLKLPTLFRGVFWDAHWEFDAPCVIYGPICRYGFGWNSSAFDRMVQDICIDIACGRDVGRGFCEQTLKEFKWRGWSLRGFSKRKEAWHLEMSVVWREGKELSFDTFGRREQWGPFDDGIKPM